MTKGEQIVAMTVGKTNRDGYPKLTENHPFFEKLKAFIANHAHTAPLARSFSTTVTEK